MPIYEYKCEACGGNYEQMRRMSEADNGMECPSCKSHEVNRQLSSFATTSGTPDRAPARMGGGGCGMGACGTGGCGFGNN
jgi:putative FmdB family regulatory protein